MSLDSARCADGSCWRPAKPEDHTADITQYDWDMCNDMGIPYKARIHWLKMFGAACAKLTDTINEDIYRIATAEFRRSHA